MNTELHNPVGDSPLPVGFTIRAEISQSDKGGKPGGGKKQVRVTKKASRKAPGGRASKKSK